MFTAIDVHGYPMVASSPKAKASGIYHCPKCGNRVVLQPNVCGVPRFSHLGHQGCFYGEDETEEYLELKKWLYDYFTINGHMAEAESMRFDFVEPDIIAFVNGEWIAIEILRHDTTIDEIRQVNAAYKKQGVAVLWIQPKDYYDKYNMNVEFGMEETSRYLYELYGDVAYTYSGKNLYAIKVHPARRWDDDKKDKDIENHKGGYYNYLTDKYLRGACMYVALLEDLMVCKQQATKTYPEAILYNLRFSARKNMEYLEEE